MRDAISRRGFLLSGMASLADVVPAPAKERTAAAIDWAMLETALGLGIRVVAGAELRLYRKFVVEPELPAGIVDLGLRGTVNFEVLLRAAPDLILISPWYSRLEPNLTRIAPVLSMRVHERGRDPYSAAEAVALELGRRFDCEIAAASLVARARQDLMAAGDAIASTPPRPILVISIGDPRHFRVFGADSMVGAVLKRLRLTNAWDRPTSYGANAPIDIVALAEKADATIVILAPVPGDVRRVLPSSAIWHSLPAVRDGRVLVIDPVNHFGGLPAATRLARLLRNALVNGAPALG